MMKNEHVYGHEQILFIGVNVQDCISPDVVVYRCDRNNGGVRDKSYFPVTRASLLRCQRAQLALMERGK